MDLFYHAHIKKFYYFNYYKKIILLKKQKRLPINATISNIMNKSIEIYTQAMQRFNNKLLRYPKRSII